MDVKIIKTDKRYLSEVEELGGELPFGVLDKAKADVGGSFMAIRSTHNYIIICPTIDLVESLAADTNNPYPVFKCYGGTTRVQWECFAKAREADGYPIKIAVTFNSLPKLLEWTDPNDYWVLVDEYHTLLSELDYRQNAIMGVLDNIKKFPHYTFLSATPIDDKYEIDFLKKLPHTRIEWANSFKIKPIVYNTYDTRKATALLIMQFLSEQGLVLPNINGEHTKVEQLYIFLNSVVDISTILRSLELADCELDPNDVRIICANKKSNQYILDRYPTSLITTPSKKINIYTKKGFNGCNQFSNNGLVVVVSNPKKHQSLVDISTDLVQIAGRLRLNDEYQNCFRHIIYHITNSSVRIQTDEEFERVIAELESDADKLIDGWNKLDPEQRDVFFKKMNIEAEIVSLNEETGMLEKNTLKKQSLFFKRDILKSYQQGIEVTYQQEGYDVIKQSISYAETAGIKLAQTIQASFKNMLQAYLAETDESVRDEYLVEYPEFGWIKKQLDDGLLEISQLNSLKWNRERVLERVDLYRKLESAIYGMVEFRWMSNEEILSKMKTSFAANGITLPPKLSYISKMPFLKATFSKKTIGGKRLNGLTIEKNFVLNPSFSLPKENPDVPPKDE